MPIEPTSPLVSAAELAELLDGPQESRPTLVDVRWVLGGGEQHNRESYLEGHLPGASFLDLESALSDPVTASGAGGRHPMPSPERVQEGLRAAGVRSGRPVVFYDARASLGAARAWWVASYFGVEAHVLDGGLAAWQEAGLPVESGPVEVPPGDVVLEAGGRPTVDAIGVQDWVDRGGQLLDARPADRFRGENETIDPVAGHIPGARSLPALELLDDHGRFLPANAITALMHEAGADPERASAVYCGSGVQAAHVALALEAVGLPTPAVYVGSWSDWISGPDRPVATGPA
ncbi:sulfurtransferase [Ornithinimicrobium tianjinense]|uniref:Sulfurtransferase n=1 Tax=Ornithinimicrobium tianjinense TaxID=1195761 RepID=A0A917BKE9_9MICO|nr:sulfurtransferase [Ornithinimicrobium tianjinense]GGF49279.1 sulfurtransferase [Ornithinimicrobium tianjinense]